VRLPTIESLLGDKLTAFAPTTVGVQLRTDEGQPGELMQVAKQLFDIGTLFEAATNFAEAYHCRTRSSACCSAARRRAF
jgi:hypothetical protein